MSKFVQKNTTLTFLSCFSLLSIVLLPSMHFPKIVIITFLSGRDYWVMKYLGLWSPGLQKNFEKFVKPSVLPSYILNVCSLISNLTFSTTKQCFSALLSVILQLFILHNDSHKQLYAMIFLFSFRAK